MVGEYQSTFRITSEMEDEKVRHVLVRGDSEGSVDDEKKMEFIIIWLKGIRLKIKPTADGTFEIFSNNRQLEEELIEGANIPTHLQVKSYIPLDEEKK